MRQESALVRPDAYAGERLVHLVVQDFQRCMGSDADPEVVGPSPPVELADAVERDLEAAMVDSAKRCGDVLGPIGRASCRERVCQYVYISVVAVSLKKKRHKTKILRHIKH